MTQMSAEAGMRVAAGHYVKNLCALWESDPRLAMEVEAWHEEDVPAVEAAKEGGWTAKVAGAGGRVVYLHSRYRPVAEGKAWAEGIACENRYAVVVGGFGLGYHVKALWEKLGGVEGDAVILVSEPNIGLLKAALACEDYSEMLRARPGLLGGGVMIVTNLDRGMLVERLNREA